jgi:hypothetical protein
VHSPRDPRFDEEAARFRLIFTCEECGHFDPRSAGCAHEWPSELHRRARYAAPSPDVVFCKEFEPA